MVAGGIGALAVGFAVASWKELNAQAEHFYRNSTEGARSLSAFTAYTDTLNAYIREANDVEGAARKVQNLSKGWERNKAAMKSWWIQFITGANAGAAGLSRIQKSSEDADKAVVAATTASGLASMIEVAELELDNLRSNQLAKLKADYEEERLLARDTSLTLEERTAHQENAQRLLNERIKQESVMLEYIIDLKKQYNDLTESSPAAIKEVNALQRQLNELQASEASQARELGEYARTLTNETKKRNDELRKQAELAAYTGVSADLDALTFDIEIPFDELTAESAAFTEQLTNDLNKFLSNVNMDVLDVEAARAIDAAKAVATQINDSFKGIINNAVSGFSDLVGGAIAGTTNFGEGLLALFGDLLTQLGEIAISAGVGMLAIKKAFETLNPWVAIGAGVALVALGSAISNSVTALSNNIGSVGSGYSVGSGGQSYASTLNRAPSSEPVEVTGRFEIRGDDLVAVIGRNQKRKSYVG